MSGSSPRTAAVDNKERVLKRQSELKGKGLEGLTAQLRRASGFAFYNTSRYDFEKLLADAPHLAANRRMRLQPPPSTASRRVDAAAHALLRESKNPTVALVRDRMGGGSPNLVAPTLQRWRSTFAAQPDENGGSALEILPPAVLEILQALWSRALFEAHRVRADAPSAADALAQLNETIRELQALTERLQAREVVLEERKRPMSNPSRECRSALSNMTSSSRKRSSAAMGTQGKPQEL